MDGLKDRTLEKTSCFFFREKDFYTGTQIQPEMKFVPGMNRPKVGRENPHIEH